MNKWGQLARIVLNKETMSYLFWRPFESSLQNIFYSVNLFLKLPVTALLYLFHSIE